MLSGIGHINWKEGPGAWPHTLPAQIQSPELEWYYPLLRPWEQYIPITANESWVNLEEAVGWAEAHPAEVGNSPPLDADRIWSWAFLALGCAPGIGAQTGLALERKQVCRCTAACTHIMTPNACRVVERMCAVCDEVEQVPCMHVQVAAMVERATAFAKRYLSARGRDCYFVQLLERYAALQRDPVRLSSNVEYTPDWSCC